MRHSMLIGVGAALMALGAVSAQAEEPADTATTFTIASGLLSITAPADADLGTVEAGSLTVSGQLGTVTVEDSRAALVAAWAASVAATDFTTGEGEAAPAQTVAKANVAYISGPATATSGDGVFTPSVGVTLELLATAGAWAGVSSNSASWNPTLTLTLLDSQVAGEYQGTITHSVL